MHSWDGGRGMFSLSEGGKEAKAFPFEYPQVPMRACGYSFLDHNHRYSCVQPFVEVPTSGEGI